MNLFCESLAMRAFQRVNKSALISALRPQSFTEARFASTKTNALLGANLSNPSVEWIVDRLQFSIDYRAIAKK